MYEYILWILAGLIAGIGDYGLGLGFGLIASILLVPVGYDPRIVASSAAIAQAITAIPAYLGHKLAGNISIEAKRKVMVTALVLSLSSTFSTSIVALILSTLSYSLVLVAYAIILVVLTLIIIATLGLAVEVERSSNGRTDPRLLRTILASLIGGSIAGFSKAVAGGGYTVMLIAVQYYLGMDLRSAVALAPLVKLLPFSFTALVYSIGGFLDPIATVMLTLGGFASLLLAPRILASISKKLLRFAISLCLAVALVLVIARIAMIL